MGLGVLVVKTKQNKKKIREMSGEGAAAAGRCRCLSALPHCGAGQGKVCLEASGGGANYGERGGRGERGERGERSESSARPGRGSRREPGQAERHREGESRGVSAVCTGTHSWAMAPWEMTALSEK